MAVDAIEEYQEQLTRLGASKVNRSNRATPIEFNMVMISVSVVR